MHANATQRRAPVRAPALAAPRFVVVVKSGPTHDLTDQLEHHAALLGTLSPGLILTHGPRARSTRIGRVAIECLACGDHAPARLAYAVRASTLGIAAIRRSALPGLVVSYDPFRSGAIARAIRAATGAPFVCELNGAYGNPDNLADAGPTAAARRALQLRFGSWTLRAADGVRLLYDGQLAGFAPPRSGVTVMRSFDPVPLDRFRDLGEEPYILFVGHPYRRKGVDILLRAFARVRSAFPDWRLVLVGHGLAQACEASGLPMDAVFVRSPTNNAGLVPLVGRCGIFVLPSRSEAMGRVLLEAAAASKPRVGAAVDGIPSVISHGSDGLLFPKEDDAALAVALARLMASPALRRELGRAARRRVHAEFSDRRYLTAFAQLVESASARAAR